MEINRNVEPWDPGDGQKSVSDFLVPKFMWSVGTLFPAFDIHELAYHILLIPSLTWIGFKDFWLSPKKQISQSSNGQKK